MIETDAGDHRINTEPVAPAVPTAPKASTSQAGPTFGLPSKLEPFVLLGKSARGASAANLITQATGAAEVYVFSELMQLQGIKDLAMNEQYASSYQLLEIFAYGNWSDYAAKKDSLPELNRNQATKLKQLSILSLAMENRVIPYSILLSALDLPDVPALEDLLIDSFYSNILSGRLDQKEARLEVLSGIGRDVRPAVDDATMMDLDAGSASWTGTAHSVGSLTRALTTWLGTIQALLGALESQIAERAAKDADQAQRMAAHDAELQKVLSEVSSMKEKEKEKDSKEKKEKGESAGWIAGGTGLLRGILGGGSKDEMDVDDPQGSSSGGRGLKSPSGPRTRKRGRAM